ncbi:SGNH/GDSL hydrolase family protein [Paenibacillus sp. GYB004]|uniref:SGNH/GDSL hydrolase family protein n=1 Tax=Paenibacillus sp. GYB004 TaxID=2994393 RepID=UPI002F969ED2
MPDIRHYSPRSGRIIKEDGSVVNEATLLEGILTALTGGGGMGAINRNDWPSFVLFGDSITNQNGPFSGTVNYYWQPAGFFYWTQLLTGGHIKILKQAGIGGNTTTQMLARIDSDVLQYKSDYVHVLGGTNDVLTDTASATTVANLTTIYKKIRDNGSKLVIATVPPSTQCNTDQRVANLNAINKFIRDYAYANKDVILCDMFSALVDSSGRLILAGLSDDGTHPNAAGAARMGRKLYEDLNAALRFSKENMLSKSYNDSNNLLTNGILTGDSSGGATSWSFAGGGTRSKNFYDDGTIAYNEQVIDVATKATVSMYQSVTTGFAAGMKIEGLARIKFEDMTTLDSIAVKVNCVGSTQNTYSLTGNFDGPTLMLPEAIHSTPQLVIPDGTTKIDFYVVATNLTGKMKISNPTIRIVI